MSVYKQPKRKWAAEVQHKTEAGETERITQEGFTSKQKALRWERSFRPREIGNMTLREFVPFFYEDKAPHLGEETLAAKGNIINSMLLPYLGEIPDHAEKNLETRAGDDTQPDKKGP